jgi:hypothetical protein
MPSTIDGSPFNTSARNRTAVASRVPPLSARYNPAPMPIGRPMADAVVMRISVPTIALAMPPRGSPTGTGSRVNRSSEIVLAPFTSR